MPLLGLSPVLWEPSQGTTQLAQDFAKQYLSIPRHVEFLSLKTDISGQLA